MDNRYTNYSKMIIKHLKKIIIGAGRIIDYPILVLVFPICFLGLQFTIPWILRQRKAWATSAKGSPRALILRGLAVEKINKRGYDQFLSFQNHQLKWVGIMDPVNTLETKIKVKNNLFLITIKSPDIVAFIENLGLVATSTVIRELIGIIRVADFCVREKIGVLRAYGHNYQALQACLVSVLIKIPFIVDIVGNYELIHRLTGKAFYFKTLNKIPYIKKIAHLASNWLLGWPMRHAFRVLGRNKNNYEHAFALGAPVDRLSLLRISNFGEDYNSFDPKQLTARQTSYPYILLVGRLAKIKYPIDVIEAFDSIAHRLPDYRLVIIGDGPIRQEVEKRIARSEYKDRIMLPGALPSREVLIWTVHAAVAICPYSGSTLAEAMLCNIPVIAYDVEWHAEIIIDDYTGFLVPFGDIKALAAKMVHILGNYEKAKQVGQRGRDLAHVAFDKDKISQKESMIYLQALTDS